MKKYKIIYAEHQSWGVEPCNNKNCRNVHLWLTKKLEQDNYVFAFNKPKLWNYGEYCLAKEICIPESGYIKEITGYLEKNHTLDVTVDKKMMELIFRGGFRKHMPLFQF